MITVGGASCDRILPALLRLDDIVLISFKKVFFIGRNYLIFMVFKLDAGK